jgi:DNA-binding transcriptional ArsR family regulator
MADGLDCVVALKALSEETRVRIVELLCKERLGVGEISERLGVSQYNVSKHLRILREAGLIDFEKQGRERLYAVRPEMKREAPTSANVLDLGCCSFQFERRAKDSASANSR